MLGGGECRVGIQKVLDKLISKKYIYSASILAALLERGHHGEKRNGYKNHRKIHPAA